MKLRLLQTSKYRVSAYPTDGGHLPLPRRDFGLSETQPLRLVYLECQPRAVSSYGTFSLCLSMSRRHNISSTIYAPHIIDISRYSLASSIMKITTRLIDRVLFLICSSWINIRASRGGSVLFTA